ncbi:MAG: hypothetical protein NTV49_03915 [Kiritimatiellaeota bacterium]|nr:hypothetical protein [Kiritimatiellota bacterium]
MLDNIVKELRQRQQNISVQIKSLKAESRKIGMAIGALGDLSAEPVKPAARKRKMSVAGRKAMAAAARARWAKIKGTKVVAPAARKRKMSAAGRKAIAAAARARWAKIRAQGSAKKAAPAKKRRLSAAGRKAIVAAIKARWAKVRAAKAQAK